MAAIDIKFFMELQEMCDDRGIKTKEVLRQCATRRQVNNTRTEKVKNIIRDMHTLFKVQMSAKDIAENLGLNEPILRIILR